MSEWARQDRLKQPFIKKLNKRMRRVLNAQIQPVLEALKVQPPEAVIRGIKGLIREEAVKIELEKAWIDTGVKFARMTFDEISSRKSLTKKDNQDDIWLRFMERFINTVAAERIVTITNSSRNVAIAAIRKALTQAAEQGLGIEETSALINAEVQASWVIASKFRAERIARTEIIGASNLGSLQGALSTGLPIIKNWLNTPVGDFRDTHNAVASVPISEKFIVDGEPMDHPGDFVASAGNVINCRCTITHTVLE